MTLYIREEEIRHEALALGKAEGLAEGESIGLTKGMLKILAKYYLAGKITIEDAIEDSGMTKEEFLDYVKNIK